MAAIKLWRERMPAAGRWQPAYRRDIAPYLVALMIAAQTRAAAAGSAYVPAALAETGQATAPAGALVAASLAGVASTGWPLDSTMYGAVVDAGKAFSAGATAIEALAVGERALTTLVLSQLSDAARVGTAVQMAADTKVTGYVRMLVGPSCSRCIILAGAWYRYSDGFERHPRCDCRHIPATEDVAGDLTTDPMVYFRSLTRAQQDKAFGESGAEAIRLGADIFQVVNARSGTGGRTAKTTLATTVLDGQRLLATNYGTGSRGRARTKATRLMPEAIFEISETRAEAIRLLRRFGYITAP